MKTKLKGRFWVTLLLFSLIGQVAWVVENMYFNVFIYKIFAASPADISAMVAASAVSATLTTVLIGALSDRLGKRKLFISGGYILWGISILSFSLIRLDVIDAVFPMAASAASIGITLVIIMDCVMTFFGSSANDAAFNAWLTDATDDTNRGAAEGLNSMMPLLAILAVFGGFMAFDLSLSDSWTAIFLIIGVVVVLLGVLGLLLIREPAVTPDRTGYFKTVFYGFMPKTVKEHKPLYLCLLLFIIFNISIQIFMPYLIIYYEVSLGMTDYVFIMAPAIVLASVVTALWGRVYDKCGFRFSALLSLCALVLGYIVLFFFRETLPVFLGSLLMMSGYLSGMAVFGARIRDNTPEGKAGRLQGVRIFSQVLLPGLIGPFIGKTVLSNADTMTGSDGTVSFIPSADIFLAAAVPAVLLLLLVFFLAKKTPPRTVELRTPYDTGELPLPEHPNPLLRREHFEILNGKWQLMVEAKGRTAYQGEILVPYPPESPLSGVRRVTGKRDTLVYTRTYCYTPTEDDRILLHFGAVDTHATLYVNRREVGTHAGGYLSFSFDITDFLQAGNNELMLRVTDAGDRTYPYGKQSKRRGGMWYTPVSGIWQTVWAERVPKTHIEGIRITTALDSVTLTVTGGEREKCLLLDGQEHRFTGDSLTLKIENARLWTPEAPHLYDFILLSGRDRVASYFALREIAVGRVCGKPRLLLNRKPYFFHGLLDQGYFPDGIYTPASYDAFRDDILRMKEMGFNMLRKHIKIEPPMYYYYCDKYGMAVFQDMVNNGSYSFLYDTALPTLGLKRLPRRQRKRVHAAFLRSGDETLIQLHNHPSVVYYTVYNEGWGQTKGGEAYRRWRAADPTRIYDTASGWFGREESDVQSEHVYFKPIKLALLGDRPLILSEFGGYSMQTEGHVFNLDRVYGYRICEGREALTRDLGALYRNEVIPAIADGLSAAVLTQLSDVEDETNGLLTYDRRSVKPHVGDMRAVSEELFAAFRSETEV